MKRCVHSLFTLSMVVGIFGLGSFYARAQPTNAGTAFTVYSTVRVYGQLEIVRGIPWTADFGNCQIRYSRPMIQPPTIELRPDGSFFIDLRYVPPGMIQIDFLPSNSLLRPRSIYFSVPEPDRYPNPGHHLPPPVALSSTAAHLINPITGPNSPQYFSFASDLWVNVGTVALTNPGSVSGRIRLIDSPPVDMADLVVAIPAFGLAIKPNADGGYLLTGVPQGTWNVRLLGPGLAESRDTTKLTYVAAMNPTVGVNFTIRGNDSARAPDGLPGNGRPAVTGESESGRGEENMVPGKAPEKPDQTTKAEEDKAKAVIKGILEKVPKKP